MYVRCTRLYPYVFEVPLCPYDVELLYRDGHAEVFVHLNGKPSDDSVRLPNGTRASVFGHEGDTFLLFHNGQKYGVKDYHCKILASPYDLPCEVCGFVCTSNRCLVGQ